MQLQGASQLHEIRCLSCCACIPSSEPYLTSSEGLCLPAKRHTFVQLQGVRPCSGYRFSTLSRRSLIVYRNLQA